MALEFQRYGKNSVVSRTLQQELKERLRLGEQSIIMLNRRGYSTMLLCRSCGHTTSCPDCSISLTYHQEQRRLICHYCGIEQQPPSACTSCGGEYIYYVGVGSEQLEEVLRSMFPAARIARFDRDSTRRRGALRKILLEFADGNLDILVGTQMLAKGHDFPNVTLVGVIGSDAGLSFPDFRSAERTFQLLTQVAGRAGRGETPGQVVIQSFYPNHYVLRFARNQDYTGFFEREIEYRKLLGYPPFAAYRLRFWSAMPARSKPRRWAERLRRPSNPRASVMNSPASFASSGPPWLHWRSYAENTATRCCSRVLREPT